MSVLSIFKKKQIEIIDLSSEEMVLVDVLDESICGVLKVELTDGYSDKVEHALSIMKSKGVSLDKLKSIVKNYNDIDEHIDNIIRESRVTVDVQVNFEILHNTIIRLNEKYDLDDDNKVSSDRTLNALLRHMELTIRNIFTTIQELYDYYED